MANFKIIESDAIPQEIINVIFEQTALGFSYAGEIYSHKIAKTNLVFSSGQVSPSNNKDAFFRERVSEPVTIFDSKQVANNQPLFFDDVQLNGSGTDSIYQRLHASTTMTVSANTAGTRVRATRRWFNYQTGKSQLIIETGVIGEPRPGITGRIGLFNGDNGIFFESAPDGMAVVVRSSTSGSPVDNRIMRADWNTDRMDGTGPSGIDLDFSKTQIFIMDKEWLGVGTVRYGFFYNGVPYYVHKQHHANLLEIVYMSTPNLPVRYEISNDGTGGDASVTHICSTVITEGGRSRTGVERGLNRGLDPLITNNNADIYPLIGVRLKSPEGLGSYVQFSDFSVLCTTTATYAIYVIINPTIVGVEPTWEDLDSSTIQYAMPVNTTTLTGGTVIYTLLGSDSNQSVQGVSRAIDSDLTIGSSVAGVPDTLWLSVQRIAGTTETFYAALNLSETV